MAYKRMSSSTKKDKYEVHLMNQNQFNNTIHLIPFYCSIVIVVVVVIVIVIVIVIGIVFLVCIFIQYVHDMTYCTVFIWITLSAKESGMPGLSASITNVLVVIYCYQLLILMDIFFILYGRRHCPGYFHYSPRHTVQ